MARLRSSSLLLFSITFAGVIGFVGAACDSFTSGESAETGDAGGGGAEGSALADGAMPGSEAGNEDSDAAGGCGYRTTILADQPIAYWRMEGAGAIIPDETGHGHDLTMAGGGAANVTGAIHACDQHNKNKAIHFDGIATYAFSKEATSRKLDFGALEHFTIECWAQRDDIDAAGAPGAFAHVFGLKDGNAVKSGYLFYFNRLSSTFDFEYDWQGGDAGAGTKTVRASTAPTDRYAYYALTFDGSQLLLFVDGVVVQTANGPFQPMGTRVDGFAIAREVSTTNHFFAGSIDELAIYARDLTPVDIARHFTAASK